MRVDLEPWQRLEIIRGEMWGLSGEVSRVGVLQREGDLAACVDVEVVPHRRWELPTMLMRDRETDAVGAKHTHGITDGRREM